MARVLQPYIVVGMTFRDNDNNSARSEYYLPSAGILDLATALAYGDALVTLVDAMTDAVIESSSVRLESFETDPAILDAPETSEVSRKGKFKFKTEARTTAVLEVPSILNSLVVDGSNVISPLDPVVQAFITAVLQGPPGAGNGLTTGSGVQYNQFIGAEKAHRSSSNG